MNFYRLLKSCFFLLLCGISTFVVGQEDSPPTLKKQHYFIAGINLSPTNKSQDLAFSPLTYKGRGIGGSVGYLLTSEKFEFLIDGGFDFGILYTHLSGVTDAGGNIFYYVPVHTHALWKVNPVFSSKENVHFKVGAAIDFTGNYRGNFSYTNSSLNFEYVSGFGLATQFAWDVSLPSSGKFLRKKDRDFTFLWNFSLPLMGTYIRPSYNTISNFTTGANFISGEGKNNFAFIGDLVQVSSRLEFYYHLHNKNALRFNYVWRYYGVNEGSSGTSKGASHRLGIAFMFNLTGK
ncbi:hypothetical protein KMW28_15575 [Flammeovirga yaeyamensis]|uniref:Outer membrane protein beta-barrel domain-containing protein n=1 Tax=Flammeovirga yaeyamensis TaxID=367791 RepID=A0AAX1N4V9_9BACT|nr:hypothetical protein [Flammeovirga yaeyamensis]MBB3698567.1 hypothetical protein [Flammeovirga yaeyamensis]NMF34084.1 hypothetical protein [Flammeovirga yaeyamensis]QWG01072.1 hypothetical protein KMW28_15575 [Flammeovirga yaeyamensis]